MHSSHEDNKNNKVMVISSGIPNRELTDSGTKRHGKTGQIIQKITGGGFYAMGSGDPDAKFKEHVGNNSWVVITAHGGEEGGFTEVVGYSNELNDKGRQIRFKYTAKDYVDIIVQQGKLKEDSHINIMLFICNGGKQGNEGQKSFAEQIADLLKEKRINSHIAAVIGIAPSCQDSNIKELEFEAFPEEGKEIANVVVFDTDHKNNSTSKYHPMETILLNNNGISDPPNPAYNPHSMKKIYKESIENRWIPLVDSYLLMSPNVNKYMFHLNAEQAGNELKKDINYSAIIHLSPTFTYELTYRADNEILNKEFIDLASLKSFLIANELSKEPLDHSLGGNSNDSSDSEQDDSSQYSKSSGISANHSGINSPRQKMSESGNSSTEEGIVSDDETTDLLTEAAKKLSSSYKNNSTSHITFFQNRVGVSEDRKKKRRTDEDLPNGKPGSDTPKL